MTHVDSKDMLGLYALGALEVGDAAAVEGHLAECRACRAELADMEETAAELARAAGPMPPSAEVTRRILEAARTEPQLSAVRSAREGGPHARWSRGAESPLGGSRVPPWAWRPRWRLLPVATRIAVGAVVAILVASQVQLLRRLDRTLDVLGRGREFIEFIASPDVTTVALAATGPALGARALLAYDRRSGRVVLLALNLPTPPADQVYQLWLISEGVRPGLVFSPGAVGTALFHDQWSPEPPEVPLFAITLEPSPGVREPTGPILLRGPSPRARPGVGP